VSLFAHGSASCQHHALLAGREVGRLSEFLLCLEASDPCRPCRDHRTKATIQQPIAQLAVAAASFPLFRIKSKFFPRLLYKTRARVEQTIGKLKRFKRVAMRCDKTQDSYGAFVAFACTLILVKSVHRA